MEEKRELYHEEINVLENFRSEIDTHTMYRDDLMAIGPRPVVGGSELPPEGIDDAFRGQNAIGDHDLAQGFDETGQVRILANWNGGCGGPV